MARQTPQQKKRASYLRDRRNTYGENPHASRKHILQNKRLASRAERHAARQALEADLASEDPDAASEAEVRAEHHRRWWTKVPDQPLGEVLQRQLTRRVAQGGATPEGAEARVERIRRRAGRGG